MNLNMSSLPSEGDDETTPERRRLSPAPGTERPAEGGGSPDDDAALRMIDEIERQKKLLLEKVRELDEQRKALEKKDVASSSFRPAPESEVPSVDPWGNRHAEGHEQNIDEIARTLAQPSEELKKAATLDQALQIESTFPRHLLLQFARNTNRALMYFMQDLYDRRLELRMQASDRDAEEIAEDLGYISPDEMRYRIVNTYVERLFRGYLEMENIRFKIGDLQNGLDVMLGGTASSWNKDERVSPELMSQMSRLLTKIVYNTAYEIVAEQAKVASKEQRRHLTPEQFAQEFTDKSLEDLLRVMTETSALESRREISDRIDMPSNIDGRGIRHTARNKLQGIMNRHSLLMRGVSIAELEPDEAEEDAITREVRQAFAECTYQHEMLRSGNRGLPHIRLPDRELDFIRDSDLVVRLAGFDAEGRPMPSPEPDFRLFEQLEERHFLQWKKPFVDQPLADKLSPDQRRAIERFHNEGGHVGPMSREAIEFIHTHGVIFFIEKRIRENLSITLGSISALSRTPSSARGLDSQDPGDPDNWHMHDEVLKLFPQYDFAKVKLPDVSPEDLQLNETLKQRILICRSSVISRLGPDVWEWQWEGKNVDYGDLDELDTYKGLSLRRLGLAARLKAEVFEVAKRLHSKYLTFNIGTLLDGQGGLEMMNKPSAEHNRWTPTLGWRDYHNDIGGGAKMIWCAYRGKIEDGLNEFYRPHGLLKGKGWNIPGIRESARKHAILLLMLMSQKRQNSAETVHAQW